MTEETMPDEISSELLDTQPKVIKETFESHKGESPVDRRDPNFDDSGIFNPDSSDLDVNY